MTTTAKKTPEKTTRRAINYTTIFVLRNIDTGEVRYFGSVEAAQGAGDAILDEPMNAALWTYFARNFSKTSATGYQKTRNGITLQITPETLEG